MIRSTVNQSTKTIASSGSLSQSLETVLQFDGAHVVYSETTAPHDGSHTPVPSDAHWDGTLEDPTP